MIRGGRSGEVKTGREREVVRIGGRGEEEEEEEKGEEEENKGG